MDLSALSSHEQTMELLPNVIDRLSRDEPSKTWALLVKDPKDPSRGFQDVTYKLFANAINRAAWFITEKVGKPSETSFPTVSYLGPSDARYFIMNVALIKCGYKMLLLSNLTTVDIRLRLLQAADCHIYACSESEKDDPVLSRREMQRIVVPEVHELLDPDIVPPYAYDRTLEQGLNDPLMVLHTSGSSGKDGFPKLIVYTQGVVAVDVLLADLPDLDGQSTHSKMLRRVNRFYTGFRIAHAGGIFLTWRFMYHGVTVVPSWGDNPLAASTLEAAIEYAGIELAALTPLTLQEIAKSPTSLEKMKKLKFIKVAGGVVPKHVGDLISEKTFLVNLYGATEHITPVLHTTSRSDWQYVHFDPSYCSIRWRESATPGLFEPIIVRNPDLKLRHYLTVFWVFPNLTEWPMGDLFSRHPTKPNHWKYEDRVDDLIVMSSGSNYRPTYFEREILGRDPRVKNALILGNRRPHLAVILEVTTDPTTLKVDDLWPLVDQCNEQAPKTNQIPKTAILIASPEKPFVKGGKGTVNRAATEQLYSEELGKIFSL